MRCTPIAPALLGLVASAMAAPQPVHGQSRRSTPSPASQQFTLAMEVNNTYVPVTAVYNGTEDLVLQAGQPGVDPGTPAYTNTSTADSDGFDTSLVFNLSTSTTYTAGAYGVSVPDMGELYGVASDVYAVMDYQEFEFSINNGSVSHELTAASQHWFACLDYVDGVQSYFLRWGVFTEEDAAPTGCVITNVIQQFEVPEATTS